MKRCPTCNKTFTDQNLSFCIDDGTPLLHEAEELDSAGDEETIVSPAAGSPGTGPARQSESRYQPPGSYVPPGSPPGQQGSRKTWPWVLGCLAILLVVTLGLVITAKILFPALRDASSNTNNNNLNANVNQGDANANLNSNSNAENSNQDANDNSDVAETAPPTSESDVLTTLTDLEHEWTVANINADKKKLSRILADDYVGTTSDGKTQGKADYLRTIKRDTVIQRWEFDELKVSLKGDRASLTGLLRVDVLNQQREIEPAAFRFTDKFVWRDNRWQAVNSEVTPE